MGIEGRRYNLDVMMLAVLYQRELCVINASKVATLSYTSPRILNLE